MTFEEIRLRIEGADAKCVIKPEEKYGLVEFWTETAGQDIVTEFEFDGTPEGFVREFCYYAETYDVNEEVGLFVGDRGKRGIPDSISLIIEDCQEAKDRLIAISKQLKVADMTAEQVHEQMLTDCKRMLRSFTDEELEIQAQALQAVQAERERRRTAERKLCRLLEYCEQNGLELKDNRIYGREMM